MAEVVLDVMTLKTWFASVLLLTIAMLTTTLGNLYLFCYFVCVCSEYLKLTFLLSFCSYEQSTYCIVQTDLAVALCVNLILYWNFFF